ELGSKLLRLCERASHQRLPRDPGGKAKIVLDARASARLAPERECLQNQDRKALGCSIDSGRKPGRTRADDDDVVGCDPEALRNQPEGTRQVLFRGVPQDGTVRQDDDWKLLRSSGEPFEQGRGIPIRGGIHNAEGDAVAFEEGRQVRHLARLELSYQY